MVYLCMENFYLSILSILKVYYISTYEKNNSLLILCYITTFIQIFIVIYTIIMFIYNYFNDKDINNNTNHIILLYFIIGFINFVVIVNFNADDVINIFYDRLYLLIRIDIISSFIFIFIRYIIYLLYDNDII